MSGAYQEPINIFLKLDRPETFHIDQWPDYVAAYKLTDEHIPDLIRLLNEHSHKDAEFVEPESWAAVHAWRSLSQLKAEAAVEPLIQVIENDVWEDWGWEEVPEALGWIGKPALPQLKEVLSRIATDKLSPLSVIDAIKHVGAMHTEVRDESIDILIAQLKYAPTNDATFNAGLINALADLKAERALDIIERAFETANVDTMFCGSWDDIQAEFGLIEREPIDFDFDPEAPINRFELMQRMAEMTGRKSLSEEQLASSDWKDSPYWDDDEARSPSSVQRNATKQKKKKKAKRKAAKKARKRNRKRK